MKLFLAAVTLLAACLCPLASAGARRQDAETTYYDCDDVLRECTSDRNSCFAEATYLVDECSCWTQYAECADGCNIDELPNYCNNDGDSDNDSIDRLFCRDRADHCRNDLTNCTYTTGHNDPYDFGAQCDCWIQYGTCYAAVGCDPNKNSGDRATCNAICAAAEYDQTCSCLWITEQCHHEFNTCASRGDRCSCWPAYFVCGCADRFTQEDIDQCTNDCKGDEAFCLDAAFNFYPSSASRLSFSPYLLV